MKKAIENVHSHRVSQIANADEQALVYKDAKASKKTKTKYAKLMWTVGNEIIKLLTFNYKGTESIALWKIWSRNPWLKGSLLTWKDRENRFNTKTTILSLMWSPTRSIRLFANPRQALLVLEFNRSLFRFWLTMDLVLNGLCWKRRFERQLPTWNANWRMGGRFLVRFLWALQMPALGIDTWNLWRMTSSR